MHQAMLAWSRRPLLGDLNTANLYGNPPSHHPGPMAWYLICPWVLAWGPQTGAWLYAIVANLTSMLIAGWLAYRSAGFRAGAVALLGTVAAYAVGAPGQLASVYLQLLPLVPVAVALLACWAVARGDSLALPVAIGAASFAVQSATVAAPLLLLCGFGAVASGVAAHRRAPVAGAAVGRHLAISVAVTVACWAPPLWDQAFETGNLGRLARVRIRHAGWTGARHELRLLGSSIQDVLRPPWWFLVALVALVVLCRVGRRPSAERAGAIIAGLAIVGTAATGAVIPADDIEATHHLWVPMVGVLLVALATGALVGSIDRLGAWGRLLGVIGTFAVLSPLLPLLQEPRAGSPQDRDAMHAVDELLPAVLDAVPPGPVRVTFRGSWGPGRIAQALLPRLLEHDRAADLAQEPIPSSGGPTLVVLRARPTRWQVGEVVGTYVPPPTGSVPSDDLAAEIDRWARANGPLELKPVARAILANLVDGWAGAICIDDILEDPELLLALGPDVAARAYGTGIVASPPLPKELADQIDPWQAELPVTILRLDVPDVRPGDFVFSRNSC